MNNTRAKILVINTGSTSCKFSFYAFPEEKVLAKGVINNIGKNDCSLSLELSAKEIKKNIIFQEHLEGLKYIFQLLVENQVITDLAEIKIIGHRIVHGGENLTKSMIVDQSIAQEIKQVGIFAPLHNYPAIKVINSLQTEYPQMKHVAVFDTSFHQTMPSDQYTYGIPLKYSTQHKLKRYGFHGTNCRYVLNEYRKAFPEIKGNIIIAHIGGGSSITAVNMKNQSIWNSMGLTPLGGLMMVTRSGDLDPTIIEHMMRVDNLTIDECMKKLWYQSGVEGVSEILPNESFIDVQNKAKKHDPKCELGFALFCNSIEEQIAKAFFKLKGNVEAILFTAGIPENSTFWRDTFFTKIKDTLNIELINQKYQKINEITEFSTNTKMNKIFVIPANEEIIIARDAYQLLFK